MLKKALSGFGSMARTFSSISVVMSIYSSMCMYMVSVLTGYVQGASSRFEWVWDEDDEEDGLGPGPAPGPHGKGSH